jgi:hypothetical protein
LLTRAVLGRSGASQQLAPQRYRRLGALFFQMPQGGTTNKVSDAPNAISITSAFRSRAAPLARACVRVRTDFPEKGGQDGGL